MHGTQDPTLLSRECVAYLVRPNLQVWVTNLLLPKLGSHLDPQTMHMDLLKVQVILLGKANEMANQGVRKKYIPGP